MLFNRYTIRGFPIVRFELVVVIDRFDYRATVWFQIKFAKLFNKTRVSIRITITIIVIKIVLAYIINPVDQIQVVEILLEIFDRVVQIPKLGRLDIVRQAARARAHAVCVDNAFVSRCLRISIRELDTF
jgi:hypothetical protein